MILSVILAGAMLQSSSLKCAVMPARGAGKPAMEYAGAKYTFCCGGCPGAFAKDPAKFASNDKETVGEFLFDPVAGEYVDLAKSKIKMDYKGIRYSFLNDANLATFKKDPAKFTKTPKMEVLQCPMSNEKLEAYTQAYGYVDVNDVRYYVCCNHCLPNAKKNPAAAAKNSKRTPVAPKAMNFANLKPEIH